MRRNITSGCDLLYLLVKSLSFPAWMSSLWLLGPPIMVIIQQEFLQIPEGGLLWAATRMENHHRAPHPHPPLYKEWPEKILSIYWVWPTHFSSRHAPHRQNSPPSFLDLLASRNVCFHTGTDLEESREHMCCIHTNIYFNDIYIHIIF